MAYCVKCGVELQKGSRRCLLCHTIVNLPEELQEIPEEKLYPEDKKQKYYMKLDKKNKGIIEVLTLCMIISIIVIVSSTINNKSLMYIPLLSIITAYILILLPFMINKKKYLLFTSYYSVIISLFLLLLDYADKSIGWSYYCVISIILSWIIFVLPIVFKKNRYLYMGITDFFGILTAIFFFALLNNGLDWYLVIVIPIVTVLFALVAINSWLIFIKNINIIDIFLSIIISGCILLSTIDFVVLKFIGNDRLYSWSDITWKYGLAVFILLFILRLKKRIMVVIKQKTHI